MQYENLIFLASLLASSTTFAGNLASLPKTFSSGETALASEVNANFEALRFEVDDNANSKQNSVAGTCTVGSSIRQINTDGTVVCETYTNKQNIVAGTCAVGSSIRQINVDGTVVCETIKPTAGGDITGVTAGAGLIGGGSSGEVILSVNPSYQLPPGMISFFARSNCPAGWLKADGSEMLTSDSPDLAIDLLTLFGSGTINLNTVLLPDLRGEFIRGWDDGAGVDPGRALGEKQLDTFASHTHSLGFSSGDPAGPNELIHAKGSSNVTGSTGGTETRPRNIALLPCMKI